MRNYPNPFNPETTIYFSTTTNLRGTTAWQAEGTENTEIIIYNIKGERIRTFKIQNPTLTKLFGMELIIITIRWHQAFIFIPDGRR